jgi:hypothetical protein
VLFDVSSEEEASSGLLKRPARSWTRHTKVDRVAKALAADPDTQPWDVLGSQALAGITPFRMPPPGKSEHIYVAESQIASMSSAQEAVVSHSGPCVCMDTSHYCDIATCSCNCYSCCRARTIGWECTCGSGDPEGEECPGCQRWYMIVKQCEEQNAEARDAVNATLGFGGSSRSSRGDWAVDLTEMNEDSLDGEPRSRGALAEYGRHRVRLAAAAASNKVATASKNGAGEKVTVGDAVCGQGALADSGLLQRLGDSKNLSTVPAGLASVAEALARPKKTLIPSQQGKTGKTKGSKLPDGERIAVKRGRQKGQGRGGRAGRGKGRGKGKVKKAKRGQRVPKGAEEPPTTTEGAEKPPTTATTSSAGAGRFLGRIKEKRVFEKATALNGGTSAVVHDSPNKAIKR